MALVNYYDLPRMCSNSFAGVAVARWCLKLLRVHRVMYSQSARAQDVFAEFLRLVIEHEPHPFSSLEYQMISEIRIGMDTGWIRFQRPSRETPSVRIQQKMVDARVWGYVYVCTN